MALTTYLISQASDHLSDKHVQLWLLLFRKLPKYREYAFVYSDTILARITATEGTVKARMLNALMKEIDELEVGEVAIKGDREGTHWSQTLERLTLIEEGLEVLFDDITTMILPSTGTTNTETGTTYSSSGGFAVATGNRGGGGYCHVCHSHYIHRGSHRYCGCF